jgi:hypothetical protein
MKLVYYLVISFYMGSSGERVGLHLGGVGRGGGLWVLAMSSQEVAEFTS